MIFGNHHLSFSVSALNRCFSSNTATRFIQHRKASKKMLLPAYPFCQKTRAKYIEKQTKKIPKSVEFKLSGNPSCHLICGRIIRVMLHCTA